MAEMRKVLQERTQAGPSVPPPPPSSPKEVERDPKPTMDQVYISSLESTARVPYPVVQPSPDSRSSEHPKWNPHQPPIPYLLRLNKDKLQDKSDIKIYKFLQMFKKLHFNISLAEALVLRPKYAKMLKDLLSDKEKLLGLANTSLTENCSAVLLKKLPEKFGDPGKFLIPCDFPKLKKCMALADLGASINLMPLSVWNKLMLPKLIPTRMTLELANRSVAYPAGIAEDVVVQVGKFTFPAEFVVVDYDVDPRVPLILGRPFLRTARALVDKSFHPFSGSTTSPSDSFPSLTSSETGDSSLEEFTEELALLDPFLPGNKDDNFDPEADLRKIEYLLNRDPSTDSSPETDIDIIDPILERFIDEPALVYSFPPGDDDDDLFDFKSNNEKWKKLFNSTLPEESSELSEIATLLSSPFGNEDKVFNPCILILGGTRIFHDESKDKDLKVNFSRLRHC
ncbi:reverse transcriptase domain-containing protein [Tanacetum coccineum]